MNAKDELVKISRIELTRILDATVEAYNLLDGIKVPLADAVDRIERVYRLLEDIPADVTDVIEEYEEEKD